MPPTETSPQPEIEVLQPGVWHAWRVVWRMGLLILFTLGFYGVYLIAWPLVGFQDSGKRRVRRALVRAWGACFLRICGIRLEVEGTPPPAPFFLVSNHVTYMDAIVLSRILGCVFIGKDDMAEIPVFGWMAKHAQQLFIRREDFRDSTRALEEIQATMQAGDGMVVFAEARCTRGVEVAPFKSALFQAPVNLGVPVHFAALHYETAPGEPAASDTMVWWRWEPMMQQMKRMMRVRSSRVRVRFGASPVIGTDRKEVARLAHEGVCALFEPMAQGVLHELPVPEGVPKHLR